MNNAFEENKLEEELKNMNFEEFKKLLGNWLQKGQFVWYVSGNYDWKEASKLVEETRKKFGMEMASIESLPKVQIAELKSGTCTLIEE